MGKRQISAEAMERKRTEAREQAEHDKAYREGIKRGYTPDRETLTKQLNEQLDDAKISPTQYEWGMKGLDLVYGLVKSAGPLTEDEAAIVEGYDERVEVN